MRKKNGFTLVELLAVIVILAIIMIISIPAVLNTMQIAREKTFGEYVTKVYTTAQTKRLSDSLAGTKKDLYNIETDLGLSSTGDYKGYVLFATNSNNEEEVYISLTNGEYYTATQTGETESSIVKYINYTKGGEPVATSTIERFNGQNVFIRGKLDTIDPPPLPTDDDYIEIKPNTTIKDDFETELQVFYKKAATDFKQSVSNGTATKFEYTCVDNHDHGYIYQKIYDYNTVTGDNNPDHKGFIIFYDALLNGDSMLDVPLNASMLAYRNKNYHTATDFVTPTDETGTNFTTYKVPVEFYIRAFEEIPYSVTYKTSNTVFDQLGFSWEFSQAVSKSVSEAPAELKKVYLKYTPTITYTNNTSQSETEIPSALYNYDNYIATYHYTLKDMSDQLMAQIGIYQRP